MSKTLIWCTSVSICLSAFIIIASRANASLQINDKPFTADVAVATPTETILQSETVPINDEKEKFNKFAGYILEAINSAAKPDQYTASYEDVANDIATVVLDPKEPPIWKSDKSKARTAIMLVSLAYNETRFRAYTDDGRCNSSKWRKSSEGSKLMKISGECDGGLAHSMWQIHTGLDGIVVVPTNYGDDDPFAHDIDKREWCYSYQCSDKDGTLITPTQMSEDRKNAIRIALHMARRSIRKGVKLCQYTGEGNVCPKGNVRYSWAEGPKGYSTEHPFT